MTKISNKKNNNIKLSGNMKVSDIISSDFTSLIIITRFGIPLGLGDSTLNEVCKKYNVDLKTLILVLNVTRGVIEKPSLEDIKNVDLDSLIRYLTNSHHYFIDFRLPKIRRELMQAIVQCPREIASVIESFFDEYVIEVRKHMSYEDKTVFPYARNVMDHKEDKSYNIGIFSKKHDQIELKITELKNIIIKYYPAESGYELTSVLHDIFACENDLAYHNMVEDFVFVPYIELMEKEHLS